MDPICIVIYIYSVRNPHKEFIIYKENLWSNKCHVIIHRELQLTLRSFLFIFFVQKVIYFTDSPRIINSQSIVAEIRDQSSQDIPHAAVIVFVTWYCVNDTWSKLLIKISTLLLESGTRTDCSSSLRGVRRKQNT